MSFKKNNNWLIVLVIGIILFIIYWHYYKNQVKDEKDAEESETIQRLRRIDNLNREKGILNSHLKKNIDLKVKIDEQSEKLWKRFIRVLIIFLILSNTLYFLIFKAFSLENILTLYSIIIGALNIIYLFFFYKFFSIKKYIFNNLKEYSYKIVAGNRDAEYYETRSESIKDRIDQIDFEIEQLNKKNNQLK